MEINFRTTVLCPVAELSYYLSQKSDWKMALISSCGCYFTGLQHQEDMLLKSGFTICLPSEVKLPTYKWLLPTPTHQIKGTN